jgi:hypothetical protein
MRHEIRKIRVPIVSDKIIFVGETTSSSELEKQYLAVLDNVPPAL